MIIKIKLLNGQFKTIELNPSDKILKLKEILEESEGISPDQQRLIFGGKQLQENKSFEEHKIKDGAQISLLLALTGGF